MIGGLITAYVGVLLIIPVLYSIAKRVAMHREFRRRGGIGRPVPEAA